MDELDVDSLKKQLGDLQTLLLDASDPTRKRLKIHVRDVKMALKRAVRAFKNNDGIVSECSSVETGIVRLDIEKMKTDLALLQELYMDGTVEAPGGGAAQMAATGPAQRKALKSKVNDLKKALKVAVASYKAFEGSGSATELSETRSASSAHEDGNIKNIKAELVQLQEFLMGAPRQEREGLLSQVRGARRSLQVPLARSSWP